MVVAPGVDVRSKSEQRGREAYRAQRKLVGLHLDALLQRHQDALETRVSL
jgi:hypothetical protein